MRICQVLKDSGTAVCYPPRKFVIHAWDPTLGITLVVHARSVALRGWAPPPPWVRIAHRPSSERQNARRFGSSRPESVKMLRAFCSAQGRATGKRARVLQLALASGAAAVYSFNSCPVLARFWRRRAGLFRRGRNAGVCSSPGQNFWARAADGALGSRAAARCCKTPFAHSGCLSRNCNAHSVSARFWRRACLFRF